MRSTTQRILDYMTMQCQSPVTAKKIIAETGLNASSVRNRLYQHENIYFGRSIHNGKHYWFKLEKKTYSCTKYSWKPDSARLSSVLALLKIGNDIAQISKILDCSPATVQRYRRLLVQYGCLDVSYNPTGKSIPDNVIFNPTDNTCQYKSHKEWLTECCKKGSTFNDLRKLPGFRVNLTPQCIDELLSDGSLIIKNERLVTHGL